MSASTRSVTLTLLIVLTGAAEAAPQAARQPFELQREPRRANEVDSLVFARLASRGIRPARPCSDAVFVRRVFLDVLGTLPTAREVRAFLRDKGADKRRALIGRLLERPEFADYQALRWSDVLRVRSEFPINLWPNAAQAYHRWIRDSLAAGMPYDAFARELLTASGSNFRVPQVNFYRALRDHDPATIARAVALTFMAARADRWPKTRLASMAEFFARVGYKATAEWKEEIVFFDPERPVTEAASPDGKVASPDGKAASPGGKVVFPDGTVARLDAGDDPRVVFAAWLTAPENPWFARAAVNRIWSWLLGRGIVDEPDDIRDDNPPSHPKLLAFLAGQLVARHYDLRHVYRLILESQTYQLSCIPRSKSADAAKLFAAYPLRRLEAEVLIDAVNQITRSTERYTSAIPEPFTFLPPTHRSIAIPDASITSSFLELFGRPPRETGRATERNNTISAAQRLHMLNSSHVQRKIERGAGLGFLGRGPRPAAIEQLYVTILSRFPTEAERQTAAAYARESRTSPRAAAIDLAWALINSAEFLYRH